MGAEPNTEVLFADFQVLTQTNQVDGLWHGFDGFPLSYHVLTTDGILGRDTLGEGSPMSSLVPWQPRPNTGNRRAIAPGRAAAAPAPFAPADG